MSSSVNLRGWKSAAFEPCPAFIPIVSNFFHCGTGRGPPQPSQRVHLDGVSRCVLDAHGGFRHPRPSVSKLYAHVRRFSRLMALPAVFLPQQRHCHIPAAAFVLAGEQYLFQLCVSDVIIQRSCDPLLLCCSQTLWTMCR